MIDVHSEIHRPNNRGRHTVLNAIKKAIELRNNERFDEAIETLKNLLDSHPISAEIEYQIGWTFDASDRSNLSIPHYKKALNLGLVEDRVGCYVALGSSLRATGEYKESRNVLEEGLKEFPDHQPLNVFLAMTKYNLGEFKSSCSDLLTMLAKTTKDEEIASYINAYLSYAKDLDQKW